MAAVELLTPVERARRRDLRRMKGFAGALLLLAAAVYVAAHRAEADGAGAWVGFVVAAAEAAMVGGLADWFAVTALFRRPLGLPIPHTELVPARKDALGESLADFVGTHFLAEDVVRERLRQVGVAGRVGAWLAAPANAARVTAEAATLLRGALTVLSDEDVQDLLERTVVRRMGDVPVGPPAGRLLGGIVDDGAHHGLVDAVADHAVHWLAAHRPDVERLVSRQAPSWSPRLLDDLVAAKVSSEVLRFATAVRDDRDHPLRASLDAWLAALAVDLRTDPETMARADALMRRFLDHPQARTAMKELGATVRRVVLEAVDDPESDLRLRVRGLVADLGRRLADDGALRGKVDGWVGDAAAHVVVNYRGELTTTISQTVRRWDGHEAARRIELQVGRDLQFVRVNGTVVGALVGLVLHGVATAF
jgi:uncharacterized membrane-anchored protein YjiN (DUF445 family)